VTRGAPPVVSLKSAPDDLYWLVESNEASPDFTSRTAPRLIEAIKEIAQELGYTVVVELGDVPLDQLQLQPTVDEQGVPLVIATCDAGRTFIEIGMVNSPPEAYALAVEHACAAPWWQPSRRREQRSRLHSDYDDMMRRLRTQRASTWTVVEPRGLPRSQA